MKKRPRVLQWYQLNRRGLGEQCRLTRGLFMISALAANSLLNPASVINNAQ